MSTIIGGSPSTGSSLLVNILNRHPEIFAGPETYLFIHRNLYQNWATYKNRIIKPGKIYGLKSSGWFLKNGADLLQPAYGWSEEDLKLLIAQSPDFKTFCEAYFKRSLEKKGTKNWIEKTPSNAYCFPEFLKLFPNGKVIHTYRNPYDTVASLMSRGYDVFYAVGAWICNTAFALRAETENYFEIKYVNLIETPEKELRRISEFLNLTFLPEILIPDEKEKQPLKMAGWKQDERGAVKKSSLGRFYELEEETQNLIKAAFNAFEISDTIRKYYNIKYSRGALLCERLGFDFFEMDPKPYKPYLRKLFLKDIFKRTYRLYPTHFLKYPAKLV